MLSRTGNISRQVLELTDVEEHCTGADPDALPSSKPSVFSCLKYRKIKRPYDEKASCKVPASQRLLSHGKARATKRHIMNGRKLSIKMRLKPASVNFPKNKHNLAEWRQGCRYGSLEDKLFPLQADPPQGSVECKELFNETSAQWKRYKEQGEAGTLLCSICGRFHSKAFANSHRLASHAFVSSKPRLRADHLGLHKALCVLMGCNSDVTGNTWVRQILPDAEALPIKEDLILWPPLTIILNSTTGSIGFSLSTIKVCRGKPANQNIMVVKFLPTFSGLQEAERLHKYYAEKKRGREDTSGTPWNLFYMVGLDKLEFETKKKCLVKSKKDTQRIADAPIPSDK
ncbi:hypothetical protein AQUCO_08200039v1 [Aquilegia coerulea]|uniref:XS domain-containing protein n=1 Tax=Aquilegia coerulea TaxID=218851 RepID=A0A2G5C8V7_AQUCA|nr:hypothetical protein AQUCO_08200039v1 [Aquilegia coerulea]